MKWRSPIAVYFRLFMKRKPLQASAALPCQDVKRRHVGRPGRTSVHSTSFLLSHMLRILSCIHGYIVPLVLPFSLEQSNNQIRPYDILSEPVLL